MKKQIYQTIAGIISLFFLFGALQAQTVTLTFTGKDINNNWVRLDHVVVTNLTKGWQETLVYPDTTLTMQNSTGIGDMETRYTTSLQLYQNNPNPFAGTTDVNLTVADAGAVTLEIADVNGKIVETWCTASLPMGTNQFRISLSAAGTYVLTARQNGKTSSIKMVCNGAGNGNGIEYTGTVVETRYTTSLQPKSASPQPKSITTNPFTFGDMMEYVGYATINGTEVESQRIMQAQGASQTFALQFDTSEGGSQSCPPTIADIDGNVYNTVMIGTQCWMKENLRTTKSANNIPIAQGSDTSTTTAYWYYPNNDAFNKPTYGLLYNWPAVMHGSSSSATNPSNVQGICPTGWHVPSDTEWTQLTDYVSSQSQYVCGSDNTYIAKALASTTGWNSNSNTCAVGNTPADNNTTGFSALPAGYYAFPNHYEFFGIAAKFWSATEFSSSKAYNRDLNSGFADVYRSSYLKYDGYSVRCVWDESQSASTETTIPTVTTAAVRDVTSTTATCGGYVTYDGGATVAARGVCWSTSHNPTVGDIHTTNGTGTGSFTSSLTNLTPNTTYYVRAYATNSEGTSYGNEINFTTSNPNDGQPCSGTPTLTDRDGNTYNTVQIGSQCWMRENLRTTKYANNTPIAQGSDTSTTTAYWYYPNNDASNKPTYGLLYNWKAVMGNATSSSANPSGVQGICPTGWHVPSDAEWTQLHDYVSSYSQYRCGNSCTTCIAKSLASTTGWNSNSNTCTVGNTPGNNNATSFSALPAGSYYESFYNFGDFGDFWSATENGSSYAHIRWLMYDDPWVADGYGPKISGYSVRCVKD